MGGRSAESCDNRMVSTAESTDRVGCMVDLVQIESLSPRLQQSSHQLCVPPLLRPFIFISILIRQLGAARAGMGMEGTPSRHILKEKILKRCSQELTVDICMGPLFKKIKIDNIFLFKVL